MKRSGMRGYVTSLLLYLQRLDCLLEKAITAARVVYGPEAVGVMTLQIQKGMTQPIAT